MFYIAIVGRPNVGKSTLFNKIVGGRPAIVDNTPGVTRDRHVETAYFGGKKFRVIDSGGFEPDSREIIPALMREQTLMAVEESDAIFFVVDGRTGPTPSDEEIARQLRKSEKQVSLLVNKLDTPSSADQIYAFSRLGFENVFAISAEHSIGIGAALGHATEVIKEPVVTDEEGEPADEKDAFGPVRIAVVGKPNVGKSSLVNRILGKERMMVSDIAGTTRDSIDTAFTKNEEEYVLVDTAGLRKKAKVTEKLEKYSVIMAIKAIERADLALLVIDATDGIAVQEAKIAGLIDELGCACVIVVNKWDAIEKDEKTTLRFEESIYRQLKFLSFAPIVFVSAMTGQRVDKVFSSIDHVMGQYRKRIGTSELNSVLATITRKKEPPIHRKRRIKIYFATQAKMNPPTFVMMTSYPEGISHSYRRYMVNQLRDLCGFGNSPIKLLFRKPAGRRTNEARPVKSK